MAQDLEKRVQGQPHQNLESEEEQKISDFLKSNSIKYHYKSRVFTNLPNGEHPIYRPHFYLHEFGIYIELFGQKGEKNYSEKVAEKEAAYSEAGAQVISVAPWMLEANWHQYIMNQLKIITKLRYKKLMKKPYFSPERPAIEDRPKGQPRPKFKSKAEETIANFLNHNSIQYKYEPDLALDSEVGQIKVWHPDYYLPEFGIYIEYYGKAGDPDYDKGIEKKKKAYSKAGIESLEIYWWELERNWKQQIMNQLKTITTRRHETLMQKPYWSQNQSATPRQRTPVNPSYGRRPSNRYNQKPTRHSPHYT